MSKLVIRTKSDHFKVGKRVLRMDASVSLLGKILISAHQKRKLAVR
ncbi:Uncharacterised protein [Vibrio cholerae]|nr:Uncharacterised protein [Vibrio cholerae]